MSIDSDLVILITGILAALGGLITAVATCFLAYFAFTTFSTALRQLELMSQDSDRQTRPYVTVDLAPGLHGSGHWDLTIENTGHSPARHVTIDAGALEPRDDEDHISEKLSTYLRDPFTLHPGTRRRLMWRTEAREGRNEAGGSAHTDITVGYKDDREVEFLDTFTISPGVYGPISPAPTKGPKLEGSSRTKAEASLANIERALRTLNHHVGMLRH